MKQITLTDLIDVQVLQQIQDGFSKYTGMAALTTDSEGVPVTKGSGFTTFCMELTRKSKEGCKHCEECDKNGALLTLKNGHATAYDCHAGLMDFAAPIMVEGIFLGSVIGGQVRTKAVDEDKMRETALAYGIDPKQYIAAAKETKCLEKEEVQKAAIFLQEIAEAFSSLAYSNYLKLQESIRMEKAAKSQADFVMNMSMNLEKSMGKWFNIVEETIQNTDSQDVRDLLGAMQDDGDAMRSNIKDTIDYIRMSESKIEILETDYELSDLLEQLQVGLGSIAEEKNIPLTVEVGECVTPHLMGDIGRIGQMLNKTLRAILEQKKQGSLKVELSTSKKSYAAILCAKIIDEKTIYSSDDMERIQQYFEQTDETRYFEQSNELLWLSLEGVLLKKMSGTILFDKNDDCMTITINLPQLGL